jgi:hypothetical protein
MRHQAPPPLRRNAPRCRGARTAVVFFALLVSVPASGEIYRWTNAQGREYLSTQLNVVPPGQRKAAKEQIRGARGKVNFHAGPDEMPAREPSKRQRSEPAAAAPASTPKCAALKKELAALMKPVKYHQRALEGHERSAHNIALSKYSRRCAVIRAEKAQAWLDKA